VLSEAEVGQLYDYVPVECEACDTAREEGRKACISNPASCGITVSGSTTSAIKLTNISTRALIQGGAYNVIAGFIITGTGTQKVLIRAWGLEAEVDTLLTLQTYPAGTTLATNNNWQTDSRASEIPANMKPTGTTDAAIFINLQAGAYTAMMSTTGSKGLGLIGVDAID